MVAIFSTLPLAGTLAGFLREHDLLEVAFSLGLLTVVAAIAGLSLKRRPARRDIWVALGVTAAYLMVWIRIETPEERTHLFEYGLVAALILEALSERRRNSHFIYSPALFSFLITTLIGWIDEGIQAVLPNRVYDIRDVGFNALAALMAIAANQIFAWMRRRTSPKDIRD